MSYFVMVCFYSLHAYSYHLDPWVFRGLVDNAQYSDDGERFADYPLSRESLRTQLGIVNEIDSEDIRRDRDALCSPGVVKSKVLFIHLNH